MIKDNFKIAAIIVTYNRKQLLLELLQSILKQKRPPDGIYIIDNASTDKTSELLLKEGYIKGTSDTTEGVKNTIIKENIIINITYIRLNTNTGCSGGFYEGIKRCIESYNYDWLWLMDDDIELTEDSLYNLTNYIGRFKDMTISALIPARYYNNQFINFETKIFDFEHIFSYFTREPVSEEDLKKEFIEISTISFEGSLVSANAIKTIGYPNKDYFIFCDDTDYAIRLLKYGKIIMIPSAKIKKKILIKSDNFNWKTYYLLRNIIFLERTYGKNFAVKYIRPFITLIRFIKKHRKDFFSLKLRYIIKAFTRGYLRKLGIDINPGEL